VPRKVVLELPTLHPAQTEIVRSLNRFTVLRCGRRFGKTEVLKEIIIQDLLDGKSVAYFTPTYRMGSPVWKSLVSVLAPITAHVNNGERSLRLHTGGLLECWSLTTNTAQSVRGRKYHRVMLDEFAFIRDGLTIWEETISPLLTDYAGDAVFASTPKGKNSFYSLSRFGIDPLYSQWTEFHKTTFDNPYIPKWELEDIRKNRPQRVFEQEYLAIFGDDAGSVFRGVEAASVLTGTFEPITGHRYIGGIDWGREDDFTVLTILDAHDMRQVESVRFNEIGWTIQRDRIIRLHEKWGVQNWIGEANSIGGPNVEALQDAGIPITPFMTTAQSKRPLIESLALAIERADIQLLKNDLQIFELQAYTYKSLSGGGYSYSAPLGMHDDTVISLALAYHGIAHGTAPLRLGKVRRKWEKHNETSTTMRLKGRRKRGA